MNDETLFFLIALFFAHWVGDFVLQFTWLAVNKSKDNVALSMHVLIWSLAVTGAAYLFFPDSPKLWLFWGTNAAAHYITDYFTSRLNSYLNGKNWRHLFFASIGFDQWLHVATLLVTAQYLLKG